MRWFRDTQTANDQGEDVRQRRIEDIIDWTVLEINDAAKYHKGQNEQESRFTQHQLSTRKFLDDNDDESALRI